MSALADNLLTEAARLAPGARLPLVVGLGATGLSVARYLARRGIPFAVADSRAEPPSLDALRTEFPETPLHLGPFDETLFRESALLILSPGVAPDEPVVARAHAAGVPLFGDIELFARANTSPVLAITGSNGKSTVTALVGEMLRSAGLETGIGGNFGTPALDLLSGPAAACQVLELSSFQLETTDSLDALAAVVLNVSDDHLDRHGDLADYAALKARIFRGTGLVVVNRDDPLVMAMAPAGRRVVSFGSDAPARTADYGLSERDGETWLVRGERHLLPASAMRIAGRHNQTNALAALALASAAGVEEAPALQALRSFAGLPHRCRLVAEAAGVAWFDDSKGTNVGATLAALAGMPGEKVVLIAGGIGKGQDFSPLRDAVAQRARAVVLIGRDAPVIEAALQGTAPLFRAVDMPDAVHQAATRARPGDSVLLSPACASFDMFANYAARGDAFIAAVQQEVDG